MNPPELPDGWYWDFEIEGKGKSYSDYSVFNCWVLARKIGGEPNDSCAVLVTLHSQDEEVNAQFARAYRTCLEMVLGYPWGPQEDDQETQIQNHLRAIKAAREAATSNQQPLIVKPTPGSPQRRPNDSQN